VYLHISPTRGVKRFGIRGKLAPRYIGPFHILARLGNVAYRLELLPTLVGVHNMFRISQLKKCLKPPMDIVVDDVTPLDADLSYPEHPMKILDQQDRVTRCERFDSSRFSGADILSKRLHGRLRNFFFLSIRSSSLCSDVRV
jgi:hypothetical protein